jgi:type IV secretory pathway VirJ component
MRVPALLTCIALLPILAHAAQSGSSDPAEQAGVTRLHVGGRFADVAIYKPRGPVRSVVLFVSGDGGWHLGVTGMARHLADEGALVVGIDVRHYLAALGPAGDRCVSLAGDFELLSRDVQKQLQLPHYLSPQLVGYSSGATIVYAVLAQAPAGTFAGAISLGFCADQDFRSARLCPGAGLHYTVNRRGDYVVEPASTLQDEWIALQGQKDQVCNPSEVDQFAAHVPHAEVVQLPLVGHGFGVERNWLPQLRDAAFKLQSVAAPATVHPIAVSAGAALAELPLVELPLPAGSPQPTRLAVIISGDGGWAGLDRKIAASFQQRGIPVVGLDSLRYFWHERTPDDTARDVGAVVAHYLAAWHCRQFDLVGYSFGADVLPFVVNRLPPQLARGISSLTLVEPSSSATFEIHVSNWLPGVVTTGLPTAPELAKLQTPVLCLHGADAEPSVCRDLPRATVAQIGRGHHLGGDGEPIVERILAGPSAANRN